MVIFRSFKFCFGSLVLFHFFKNILVLQVLSGWKNIWKSESFDTCNLWIISKLSFIWNLGEEEARPVFRNPSASPTGGFSLVHGLGSFWVSKSPGLHNWHMVRFETQVSWTRFPQGHISIVETQVSTGLHGDQSSKLRPRTPKLHLNSGDLDPHNDIWGDPRQKRWLWYSPYFPHTFTNLQLSS